PPPPALYTLSLHDALPICLAIYISLALTALAFRSAVDRDFGVALALGLGIVLLGLVDDLRPLPWQVRLGLQTLAACVAVAFLSRSEEHTSELQSPCNLVCR